MSSIKVLETVINRVLDHSKDCQEYADKFPKQSELEQSFIIENDKIIKALTEAISALKDDRVKRIRAYVLRGLERQHSLVGRTIFESGRLFELEALSSFINAEAE